MKGGAGPSRRGYRLLVRLVKDGAELRKRTVRWVRGSSWYLPSEILGVVLKETVVDPEGEATRTRVAW